MKKLVFIFAFLTTSLLVAQDKFTATFDYEVSYEIAIGMKKDTIQIAFDKTGQYIWSDFSELSKNYSSLFKGINPNMNLNLAVNVIYDSKLNKIYMHADSKELSFFFKMDLAAMLPAGKIFTESFDMIADKTSNMVSIMGKQFPFYKIYPSNATNENDKINVAFDETYPMDNNTIFQGFVDMMSGKDQEGNNITIGLDLPKGLMMQISSPSPKEEVILKAIAIKKISRTITINNTLEIKE